MLKLCNHANNHDTRTTYFTHSLFELSIPPPWQHGFMLSSMTSCHLMPS